MYAKIDDRFFTHPKARSAGLEGRGLFLAALCHCSAHLTDGHVRSDMLPVIAAEAEVPSSTVDRLVSSRLWEPCEEHSDCFRVVNYLDWNSSKAQVEAKRDRDRKRQAASRSVSRTVSRNESSASPPDSPVQSSPTDSPSSSQCDPLPDAGPMDDDDRFGQLVDVLAQRRLEANRSEVRNPHPWLARTRANLIAESGSELRSLVDAWPSEAIGNLAEVFEGKRPKSSLRQEAS